MKTYTRKQYLNDECTHTDFYSQFVTENIKNTVLSSFKLHQLQKCLKEDEHLNSIPLHTWDSLANSLIHSPSIKARLKEMGDSMSLSGAVCILKAAARIIVSESEGASFELKRDGEVLFTGIENDCYFKLQRVQSHSADWAMKHEGYTITPKES